MEIDLYAVIPEGSVLMTSRGFRAYVVETGACPNLRGYGPMLVAGEACRMLVPGAGFNRLAIKCWLWRRWIDFRWWLRYD